MPLLTCDIFLLYFHTRSILAVYEICIACSSSARDMDLWFNLLGEHIKGLCNVYASLSLLVCVIGIICRTNFCRSLIVRYYYSILQYQTYTTNMVRICFESIPGIRKKEVWICKSVWTSLVRTSVLVYSYWDNSLFVKIPGAVSRFCTPACTINHSSTLNNTAFL